MTKIYDLWILTQKEKIQCKKILIVLEVKFLVLLTDGGHIPSVLSFIPSLIDVWLLKICSLQFHSCTVSPCEQPCLLKLRCHDDESQPILHLGLDVCDLSLQANLLLTGSGRDK